MANASTISDDPQLGLWDAVSVIIGIVVGVAIFKAPAQIFGNVSAAWAGLAVWALGGLLALIGALCYAELATTYPRLGGDYVFLTRAYGRRAGFLFGWSHLTVVNTANMGAMAYVFADYANTLWSPVPTDADGSLPGIDSRSVLVALSAICGLSVLNLFGLMFGKAVQNLLTIAKVLGLGLLVVAGLVWGRTPLFSASPPPANPNFGLAMIMVLYAYGGWNDAAFVAAEVRDRKRNIPRALVFGTLSITLIYLLVNVVYLRVIGFEALATHSTPATAVLQIILGDAASRGMSVLVMVSALGALNGLIYTGSRVHASLGADHPLFALLGRWNPRLRSPVWSLLVQAGVACAMILVVGTDAGRNTIDAGLLAVGIRPLPWLDFGGGFETLVVATAPIFWGFFLLSGLSLFVLRIKDRDLTRPFRVPLFPWPPTIFCGTCGYMLYASLTYAGFLALLGLLPLLLGLPLYYVSQRMTRSG